MRVVGVVDLLGGRAVHARGGQREAYAALADSGGVSVDGDPVALARSYLDRFHLTDLYLADLDAIVCERPQEALVSAIVSLGKPVWLDAGVSSVDAACGAADLGVARVIVGLETLTSFPELHRICQALGRDRVAFSLDLRDGAPITRWPVGKETSPEILASRAADAGAGAVILIDMRRVGSARGVDLGLVARVRRAVPNVTLLAGGGVRTIVELERLADAGCDGVLLATALHDGTIIAEHLAPYL
jgi:phosphoribosylformimino-5-aminoimidazole carboxamide ribotide isomerase